MTQKISYTRFIVRQNSDMILFTGDIVNTHATEMLPWLETLKKIKSTLTGKYSVLGNH
jgi:predicted MPP superfamily phosphohydrolase